MRLGLIRTITVAVIGQMIIWFQLIAFRVRPRRPRQAEVLNTFDKTKHGFVVIFASYLKYPDANARRFLTKFRERGGYVVFVTNNPRPEQDRLTSDLIDVFIDNNDHGRDFGQFRTATLYVDGALGGSLPPKIIYANDSVFFLCRDDCSFVDGLLDPQFDFVGTFENSGRPEQRQPWFVSSWLFSVSAELFHSRPFMEFFRRYTPITNKTFAVERGEIRMTRVILSCTKRIGMLYGNSYLVGLLRDTAERDGIAKASHLLAVGIREGFQTLVGAPEFDEAFLTYVDRTLYHHSPLHVFALLLLQETSFPFVKKDMFWTGGVGYDRLSDFRVLLHRIAPEPVAAEIVGFFLRRGRLIDKPLGERFQSIIGLK